MDSFILTKKYCFVGSCQYARCETQPWTSWSEVQARPGHCRTEARYQRQRKTIVYKSQVNNCNGVGPQTCPDDVTQFQEKGLKLPLNNCQSESISILNILFL